MKHDARRRLPRPSELATMTDRRFFQCLVEQGPMSRAAIAQATGISKPTISEAAQRLLGQALIVETDRRTQGHQGRSGVLYDIHARRGHSLGIALESGRLQARALDLKGGAVWRHQAPLSAADTRSDLVGHIQRVIDQCREETGTELLSLGFSVADPVNPKTGEVIPLPDSPFPVGHDLHVLDDFANDPPYAVVLDNDVNWATLAEKSLGCAQSDDDFLYVYLGQGIGAGLFQSGRLQRGADGLAGEIGYVRTEAGDTLLSLINREPEGIRTPRLWPVIGHAIATAATLLNPTMIVLGGPLAASPDRVRSLTREIESRLLRPLPVRTSTLPSNGPLTGVALGAHEQALATLGMIDAADA